MVRNLLCTVFSYGTDRNPLFPCILGIYIIPSGCLHRDHLTFIQAVNDLPADPHIPYQNSIRIPALFNKFVLRLLCINGKHQLRILGKY